MERPHFTESDIHQKRLRREQDLAGLSDVAPLVDRFNPHSTHSRLCSHCNDDRHNNRLYCYKCCHPVGNLLLPQVSLPIRLDVIRHVKESRAKSTALHAQVLAADDVRIVETPDVESLGEFDPETTLLLYPSKNAVTLAEMGEAIHGVKRIVVVDSTWQQAASVLRLPQLARLRHIKLASTYNTAFWRYQQKGDQYLATIEAIHFFFREFFMAKCPGEAYDGRFDNLLYIFVGLLRIIEDKKGEAAAASSATMAVATTTSDE